MKKILNYFSLFEWILLLGSILVIVLAFIIFHNEKYYYLAASILGVISLAFLAKGSPIGMILTVIFSLMYAYISYQAHYYGEMVTYVGMTGLIATITLVSWIRHPSKRNKNEVEINEDLKLKEYIFLFFLSSAVTVGFYFILRYLNTANLITSTISIFTSFTASYLALRRCRFYAIIYVVNDIVLIVLWSLATVEDFSYLALVICFVTFLIYDAYSFINWTKIKKEQQKSE